jgi:hypothetical protein
MICLSVLPFNVSGYVSLNENIGFGKFFSMLRLSQCYKCGHWPRYTFLFNKLIRFFYLLNVHFFDRLTTFLHPLHDRLPLIIKSYKHYFTAGDLRVHQRANVFFHLGLGLAALLPRFICYLIFHREIV